jgi:hypothetical protein
MDSHGSPPGFERIDENLRAIHAFLDERDAQRKAGRLARERSPEDVYLQLDERLKQCQQEIKAFREETRLTLASLQERVATRAELESVRDDIRIVAEGFADIRTRLDEVARLLGQYITAR